MEKILWTFICFTFCSLMCVLGRKHCIFNWEYKSEKKLNTSIVESDGTTIFMIPSFQNNCFIDLSSVFEVILNKTQRKKENEERNENATAVMEECSFYCAEKISVRFFLTNSTSIRYTDLSVALTFGRCSVYLEELSLFAKFATVWSISQSSGSVVHVPSQRIHCIFSEHMDVINAKVSCDSEIHFFWDYCEEVFKNVKILQLEACPTNHVIVTSETLMKKFPNVQGFQLKYIDLSTQLTFPWTKLFANATNIKQFVYDNTYGKVSINSVGRTIQIYNSSIMDRVHLSGMISSIVFNDANFSQYQSDIFKYVTGLYHVEISNNQMTEISAQLFKNQSDIRTIYLQGNQLKTIPENIFEDQHHLLFLDMSKNELSSIDRNLLKNQHFLQELHLENNNLKTVPLNFLKEQISSLKYLYLHSNPLKAIPVMPFYGARIELIDMHKSNITGESLIELVNDINTYDFLYADYARRNSNPRQKDGKESFQRSVLDLSFCSIKDIRLNLNVQNKTTMNMLQFVKSFNIEGNGNPFKCNCELYAITLIFKINDALKLDWVCEFPSELKGRKVTSLTDRDIYCPVNVSDCPESCVCYVRYDFSSLIIDCRNIKMEKLPTVMPKEPIELWFKNTSLLELDQRDYLVNVSVLDISENKLTHIQPIVASKLQNVSILNIENNHMTSLPVQISNTNIKKLYLKGNPFKCDCHTKWMKDWLLDRSCPVLDWNNIKCTDNTKKVKSFVTIPDSVFVCQNVETPSIAEHVIFPSTIIGSFVFVIVVLSLTIYFQRFTVRVLLYMVFGKRCHVFNKYNSDSKYDCVVIYDKRDENFVNDNVKDHLIELGYSVADIYKDSLIGYTFIDGIKKLIYYSKVTVFCLTINCLNNDLITTLWNVTYERNHKNNNLGSLILILDKEFRNKCAVENMRLFIKSGRYIKNDSILLHKSLEYLLPPKRGLNNNQDGDEYQREAVTEEADDMNLMPRVPNGEYAERGKRDIFIVFSDEIDELHKLVRYDLIPFLRDNHHTVSVLQDNFIFGEDIREGIEPKLDSASHVIFIITEETLEDEVWQYIVSTILTKAFISSNNYLLLLTYGEIDETKISENLRKFVNSHITASVGDPNLKGRILDALQNEESQARDIEDTESVTENFTDDENLI